MKFGEELARFSVPGRYRPARVPAHVAGGSIWSPCVVATFSYVSIINKHVFFPTIPNVDTPVSCCVASSHAEWKSEYIDYALLAALIEAKLVHRGTENDGGGGGGDGGGGGSDGGVKAESMSMASTHSNGHAAVTDASRGKEREREEATPARSRGKLFW